MHALRFSRHGERSNAPHEHCEFCHNQQGGKQESTTRISTSPTPASNWGQLDLEIVVTANDAIITSLYIQLDSGTPVWTFIHSCAGWQKTGWSRMKMASAHVYLTDSKWLHLNKGPLYEQPWLRGCPRRKASRSAHEVDWKVWMEGECQATTCTLVFFFFRVSFSVLLFNILF